MDERRIASGQSSRQTATKVSKRMEIPWQCETGIAIRQSDRSANNGSSGLREFGCQIWWLVGSSKVVSKVR